MKSPMHVENWGSIAVWSFKRIELNENTNLPEGNPGKVRCSLKLYRII